MDAQAIALERLKAKLVVLAEERQLAAVAELRGDAVKAEWGQQVRLYTLGFLWLQLLLALHDACIPHRECICSRLRNPAEQPGPCRNAATWPH